MKPNVIVVLSDQLRAFELGCYGDAGAPPGKPISPNIDKLARGGVRFDKAFTPNPVCTPAKSSLLSGQYGRSCIGTVYNAPGIPDNKRVVFPNKTFPEILRDAGYDTAYTNQLHIHTDPLLVGFGERLDKHNWSGLSSYEYTQNLKYTREYIQKKRDKPFLLYHTILQPHMPYIGVEEKFIYKYAPGGTPLRPNVEKGIAPHYDDQKWFAMYLYQKFELSGDEKIPGGFDINALYAMYRGMVSAADWQLGEIAGYVEEAGMTNDTIIIFLADHGDNMGSHGLYNKDCAYEESIRIPLIVSCPGHITPSESVNDVVSLIDVAPTVLDMCGLPVPEYMHGISLCPLFNRGGGIGRDRVFIECPNNEIACRTNKYMYAVLTEFYTNRPGQGGIKQNPHRFFDMEADLYQLRNNDSSLPDSVKQDMSGSIMRWIEQTPWYHG